MSVFVVRTVNVVSPVPGEPKATVVVADNIVQARELAAERDPIYLDRDLSAVFAIGFGADEIPNGVVAREVY